MIILDRAAEAALSAGIPNPGNGEAPAEVSSRVENVLQLVAWLAVAGCVAGVLFCAISMAMAYKRGDMGDQFGRLGMVFGACVLIGSASSLVGFALG